MDHTNNARRSGVVAVLVIAGFVLPAIVAAVSPPTADDQAVVIPRNVGTPLTLTGHDADGNTLTFAIDTPPTSGTLGSLGAPQCDGQTPSTCTSTVTYTPTGGYSGPDSFIFSVDDGGGPQLGTVSITVNDPPTATNLSAPETYTEDTTLGLTNIVVSDVDNATTTVTLTLSTPGAGSLTTGTAGGVTSTYVAGTGVWTASGAIAGVNTLLAGVSFVPTANYNANFTIATSVTDGLSTPITGSKAMTGIAVNDPPTATNLSAPETYTEDTTLGLTTIVVSDVDNATTTVTLTLSTPGAGSLTTGTAGGVTSTYVAGTGVWTASGAIAGVNTLLAGVSFVPTANYNANFTIATSVTDGLSTPITGSKAMTGIAVNDPPNAFNDVVRGILAGAPPTPIDVLANDTSAPDGPELLKIIAVTQGSNGAVVITGGGTGLTYQPSFSFTGSDVFTYTIEDPGHLTDTASVLIVVDAGATFVPIAPVRVLDSRFGTGLSGKFSANVDRGWKVAGVFGIPSDAVAVTGNLTVTQQSSGGYVSLTPTASANSTTSSLNFPIGDNRANGVFASLGADGYLHAVFRGSGTTHLIFDVTGYFVGTTDGATYKTIDPARSLDTRDGTGLTSQFVSRTSRSWQVTGRTGVPAEAIAVTGNVTVVGQTSSGYVSITPNVDANPATSTINFPAGDTRANNVTVQLGSSGELHAIFMGGVNAKVHLIFDVTGYFVADGSGAKYVPLTPSRLLDSRFGNGLSGGFTSTVPRSLQVMGRGGVPAEATSVTGNVTVTQQTTGGYVSVTVVPANPPPTSNLNFPKGDNRANGLVIKLDGAGKITLYFRGAGVATTHLIFDVTGYFY